MNADTRTVLLLIIWTAAALTAVAIDRYQRTRPAHHMTRATRRRHRRARVRVQFPRRKK